MANYRLLILALYSVLSSCTLTGSESRGALDLRGTIFEGWIVEWSEADLDANLVEGSYYSCTKNSAGSDVEFACQLRLADGEVYDGDAFLAEVAIVYGSERKSLTVATIRSQAASNEAFRFRLRPDIASSLVEVQAPAPVVIDK